MGVVGEGRGRILLPSEAAEMLRIDVKTVGRYARDGILPNVRLPGGHRRYFEQDVLDLLHDRGIEPPAARRPIEGQLDLFTEDDTATSDVDLTPYAD